LIVVVGVSHRTAPLTIREALAFPKDELGRALLRLRSETGVAECVILSTCNRVEIHAEASESQAAALADFLTRDRGQDLGAVEPHLFLLTEEDAIRHVFEVVASLDSMVVGETQILGQVKAAYEAAEEAGTLGPSLRTLRQRMLAAAKRVRTETEISRNAISVSHVAVELARKIFGELRGQRVLLVGAGKMSELAARQLVREGARATVVGGRTFEKAESLATALGGRAVPFEALRDELAHADVVISGTGAPGVVIRREDVAAACKVRGPRPLFLVDIAAPRDVDPAVRDLASVFLYDLDDLKAVSQANRDTRQRHAAPARAIVADELRAFLDWRLSRDAVPFLVQLRRRADDVRRAELENARQRLGELSADQHEAVEALTAAIVNKLLHSPTVHLKEAARRGEAELGVACRLLGLQEATHP
jgi:glutamyl-tRNA reductase